MAKAKPLPDVEYLRALFSYQPETGELTWNYRVSAKKEWNTRYAGKRAGSRKKAGRFVRIDGKRTYKASRIIWKIVTGLEPVGEIDHENVDHYDDRWENLRDSTRQQNGRNRRPYGKLGLPKGVAFNNSRHRFRAVIWVSNRAIWLGAYGTAQEAAAAYNEAALRLHGEFARLNDIVAG